MFQRFFGAKQSQSLILPTNVKVLTKGSVTNINDFSDLSQGLIFKMFWGAKKAVDVDFGIFLLKPWSWYDQLGEMQNRYMLLSSEDVISYNKATHIYPRGADEYTCTIIRSADNLTGGGGGKIPDEQATVFFNRFSTNPETRDISYMLWYVHIYREDEQSPFFTFKVANVRIELFNIAEKRTVAIIDLARKYPNNTGIVLMGIEKNIHNQWHITMVEDPLDGDKLVACALHTNILLTDREYEF